MRILITLPPEQVANILNGKQTIIIQKTAPKCELPIEACIYCAKDTSGGLLVKNTSTDTIGFAKGKAVLKDDLTRFSYIQLFNGKVVAKFTLKKVEEILALPTEIGCSYQTVTLPFKFLMQKSCVNSEGFNHYLKCKNGYAWHISDLQIFDKPKEIIEFFEPYNCGELPIPLVNPPKSWRYIG